MADLVRIELRKALKNKWFFIAVGLGCVLALASAVGGALTEFQAQSIGLRSIDVTYMELAPLSLYKFWIVTDYLQPATDLYFLLLPLLAVLPYSWSLASEFKSGSVRNTVIRTTRVRYFAAKYAAAFLAGALAVTIPIVLNFIVCACIMPAYMPDIYSIIFIGIGDKNLWSELYYTVPLLYCLLFTLLNFTFGGLWATVVMSLSFFVKNRVALLIVPYLVLVFIKFFEERVFTLDAHYGLTPFTYLRGTGTEFFADGYAIIVEFVAFFLIAVVFIVVNLQRDVL